MSCVLIIDRDHAAVRDAADALASRRLDAEWCSDGHEGLARALSGRYDLVALDHLLPGMDGITVVTRLRSVRRDIPVLLVHSDGDVATRVRALRAGADNCLAKPVDPEEFVACVEVLLRRGRDWAAAAPLTRLRLGPLELDLISRSVSRDGAAIALRPMEFRILEFLVRNAKRTVTRSMLFEAVWGYCFNPGTNVVDVHMRRIRAKIDVAGVVPLIKTVRGVGYRIE
jgi:two-component system OmpR family response regulator